MSQSSTVPDNVQGVKQGSVYRHFKGDLYQVIDFAVDSQTGGWAVIYRKWVSNEVCAFGHSVGPSYVRPVEQWFAMVYPHAPNYDTNSAVPRFKEHSR